MLGVPERRVVARGVLSLALALSAVTVTRRVRFDSRADGRVTVSARTATELYIRAVQLTVVRVA